MLEVAQSVPGDRIPNVGCGSEYQAVLLAELGTEVYGIEIVEPLARRVATTLEQLGYEVNVRKGDGYVGSPEHAPFAATLVQDEDLD